MAGWYVRRGEKVIGPVELDKLKELAAAGRVLPTDKLAKDAAGPWTEAYRTSLFARPTGLPQPQPNPEPEPPSLPLVPFAPPVQDRPLSLTVISEKLFVAVRVTKVVITTVGRGTLAASVAVARSLSTRAQRRHELKLAKIQAQALVDSRRPHAPAPAPARALAAPAPITFAPNIVQSTIVKVTNKNSRGCGCGGCGMILLLIVLGLVALVMFSGH